MVMPLLLISVQKIIIVKVNRLCGWGAMALMNEPILFWRSFIAVLSTWDLPNDPSVSHKLSEI